MPQPKVLLYLKQAVRNMDNWVRRLDKHVDRLVGNEAEARIPEFGMSRCVHCRALVATYRYHCPNCGRTVVEDIPEAPYTVELRITHNPTGQMLYLKDEPYSREPLERVNLAQLLRHFRKQFNLLIDRYPSFPSIEDIELPENIASLTIGSARGWCKLVRDQIRGARDKLRTLDATNDLPDYKTMTKFARETMQAAQAAEEPLG